MSKKNNAADEKKIISLRQEIKKRKAKVENHKKKIKSLKKSVKKAA